MKILKSLAAYMAVSHSLSTLDLRVNNIGSEGAKVLAPAIRDSHSLTECDLRQNKLGKEGWCAIFDALRDNPQNKITKWELGGQGIDAEIAKSLAAYMAVSHSLTAADLHNNRLDDDAKQLVRECIRDRVAAGFDLKL